VASNVYYKPNAEAPRPVAGEVREYLDTIRRALTDTEYAKMSILLNEYGIESFNAGFMEGTNERTY
jgi:hypothetical protein